MASLNHTLTLQNICDTVFKSNTAVIDSFATFLKTKAEIEDFDSYIDEFKEALHKSTFTFYGEAIDEKTEKKTKKKAAVTKAKVPVNGEKKEKNPSIYNLFVSDHIKNMQKNTGTMGRGDHMKIISNLWNNSDEGRFFTTRAQEIKKQDPSLINSDIYSIVKKEWTSSAEEEEVDTTIPLPPIEKEINAKPTTSKKVTIKPKATKPVKSVKTIKPKATKSTKVEPIEEDEENSPAKKAYIKKKMHEESASENDDEESKVSTEEEEDEVSNASIVEAQTEIVEDEEEDDEEEEDAIVADIMGEDGELMFDEE
jgi:hypothetical protein